MLAIGAHSDDIELRCGGMLLNTVKGGYDVHMYTNTLGETSGDTNQRAREFFESEFIGTKASWIDHSEDTRIN